MPTNDPCREAAEAIANLIVLSVANETIALCTESELQGQCERAIRTHLAPLIERERRLRNIVRGVEIDTRPDGSMADAAVNCILVNVLTPPRESTD